VVDAGASSGIYTVAASGLTGESGRVLTFEPGVESFDVLKRNVELLLRRPLPPPSTG
jgi:FkbM family methyltransferase